MSHHRLGHASDDSDEDDDGNARLPPSMHESLRGDSSDDDDDDNDQGQMNNDISKYDYARAGTSKDNVGAAAAAAGEQSQLLAGDPDALENNGTSSKRERSKSLASTGSTGHRSKRSASGSSFASFELELDKGKLRERRRRSSSFRHAVPPSERLFMGLQPRTAFLLLIPAAILLVIAYKALPPWTTGSADKGKQEFEAHAGLKTNGTHWFNNTVIIVSFDGFKPAYLTRDLTPNLLEISEKGLRAEYMQSIFPTLTFPNHWAIQTGLWAESHGIVGNDFWDPTDNTEFYFTHDDTSKDPKWWWGEPMWETVVKNGLRSASIMWPGPPITTSGISPTYHRPFQDHVEWPEKRDQIAQWLDMPDDTRPQLICVYLPDVDQEGHNSGPDSDQLNEKLRAMDDFSTALHKLLGDRNLLDIVDTIFVSDHGMTSTANERVVYLDEVLGEEGFAAIEHKEGWPSCGLRFKAGTNETLMVERIKKGAIESNGGYAYYTHETMPKEWHFSNNPRIAPHFLIPEVGWAISDKTEGWYEQKGRYTPIGNHGYNRSHPDMHAIFVAHGPFAETIKTNQRKRNHVPHQRGKEEDITVIPGFDNIEIYNLIMQKLLKLANVAPTNGTLGFWDQYLDD